MNRWAPYSRLFVRGDGGGWVIDDEARQLERLAQRLDIRLGSSRWADIASQQSVFHTSQFTLFGSEWEPDKNRVGVSFLHGRPGTGFQEFDICHETLHRRHGDIARLQVSNRAMEEIVMESGISPDKVHLIPLGVDVEAFAPVASEERTRERRELGIPSTAFVIGSFQKDGVGWGDGMEPKAIKGPDVFLATVERLQDVVGELFVLLTGPARGYMRHGLEQRNIPYRHVIVSQSARVARMYAILDLYLVTSRDEGGPKAVLESMAAGVPLVTTRVGQAVDLVDHGKNGYLADVDDVDALIHWASVVAQSSHDELSSIREAGQATARACSYDALLPRWETLFRGFVDLPGGHE